MKEYFRQPIVDTFDIRICTAKSVRHVVDFHSASESDLHRMGIVNMSLFQFLYSFLPTILIFQQKFHSSFTLFSQAWSTG